MTTWYTIKVLNSNQQDIQSFYVNFHADAIKTLNSTLKDCTLHPMFTVCVLKFILNQFLKPDSLLVLLTASYVVFSLFTASAFLWIQFAIFFAFLFSIPLCFISSVQFSHSVVSDFLWPRGLQHARPSCPSPSPRVSSVSSVTSGIRS